MKYCDKISLMMPNNEKKWKKNMSYIVIWTIQKETNFSPIRQEFPVSIPWTQI